MKVHMLKAGLIDLNNLKPEDIHLDDIAHGLSSLPRYNGQTDYAYTVAAHSIILSQYLHCNPLPCNTLHSGEELMYKKYKDKKFTQLFINKLRFALLLHDAQEAYIGDIIYPVKMELSGYDEIEDKVQKVIFDKFFPGGYKSFKRDFESHVKDFDRIICIEEMRVLKRGFSDPMLQDYEKQYPKGLGLDDGVIENHCDWDIHDMALEYKDNFSSLSVELILEGAYANV